MGKTVAIIQARMGSTRLPGKVMMDIGGHPMLWHVVRRERRACTLDQVVVATTTAEADDAIAAFCAEADIACFRGNAEDVLDRYYRAAQWADAQVVVRNTGDCPLLDPAVIDRIVTCFRSGAFDYVANADPPTFPDGLDTEAFSFAALECAWKEARLHSEREHPTLYIRTHPERFQMLNVVHEIDLSHLRWTVDEPADLQFARAVFATLGKVDFGIAEVCDLLRRRPELCQVNGDIIRDEGLARSLQEDRLLCN